MRHALVTGGAGFIGSHLVERLLEENWWVTVIDNFDPYYCPATKESNIRDVVLNPRCHLVRGDIRDISDGFERVLVGIPEVIVHLAAKAGVRASLENPDLYQDVNVRGTQCLLELARRLGVPQFVFASSSSVYGLNRDLPWQEEADVLRPISPYASTKVSSELMGHVFSHLYGLRFIALRLFTVYGPRQRPDLAAHKFIHMITQGKSISVYGDGSSSRDYTFIEDTVAGIRAAMEYSSTSYEVINLGSGHATPLTELIQSLERLLGQPARIDRQPQQPGDVPATLADITKAGHLLGYRPRIDLGDGLARLVDWYLTTRRSHPGVPYACKSPSGGHER